VDAQPGPLNLCALHGQPRGGLRPCPVSHTQIVGAQNRALFRGVENQPDCPGGGHIGVRRTCDLWRTRRRRSPEDPAAARNECGITHTKAAERVSVRLRQADDAAQCTERELAADVELSAANGRVAARVGAPQRVVQISGGTRSRAVLLRHWSGIARRDLSRGSETRALAGLGGDAPPRLGGPARVPGAESGWWGAGRTSWPGTGHTARGGSEPRPAAPRAAATGHHRPRLRLPESGTTQSASRPSPVPRKYEVGPPRQRDADVNRDQQETEENEHTRKQAPPRDDGMSHDASFLRRYRRSS
jgi:hypothetical protein